MSTGPLLVLSVAMLLQTPDAGRSSLERQRAVLIEEIEGAAVVEPPVFGIDTQIRAAGILLGKDDVHAVRFLLDAGQRTLLLPDPATRGHFLKRIVPLLLPLDAKQAESFCAAQSRTDPTVHADPLAVCYDQVVAHLKDWPARREAFRRALAAGAYDMPDVEKFLRDVYAQHSADFAPLLAAYIQAFPDGNPRLEEIERLADIDKKFAAAHRTLSRQARRTVAAARAEFAAAHPDLVSKKPDAAEQRSELAQSAAAESGSETGAELAVPLKNPFSFPGTSLLADDDPGLKDLPDVSTLSVDEAIRVARQQGYPGARAAMLSDVLDEMDAQLDQPRKLALAVEILGDSVQMRPSSSRLVLQAELVRWFHQQGEKPKAGDAAQALEASFDAFVGCKGERCDVFGANADNSPGELIMDFAEYLWKYEIDPAELGLRHSGLRARWLLIKLQALLEDRKT